MRTEEQRDDDGTRTVYSYDERERLIRTTDYAANEDITSDIFYEFDAEDRVSAWRYESPGGVLIKRFERKYDATGLIEDLQYDAQGIFEVSTKEVIDATGHLKLHTFDSKGQLITKLIQ